VHASTLGTSPERINEWRRKNWRFRHYLLHVDVRVLFVMFALLVLCVIYVNVRHVRRS
jgi:hypothetical protein